MWTKKLTLTSHIDYISRKMDHANYALGKSSKELSHKIKKNPVL